eukprot:scaffold67276_cov49-Phaeocystis_antarctica.AAC.1
MNTSPTGRVEGSGSSWLPNWWTSHPLHASLPALRRIGAAGVLTLALLPLAPSIYLFIYRIYLYRYRNSLCCCCAACWPSGDVGLEVASGVRLGICPHVSCSRSMQSLDPRREARTDALEP